MNFVVPRQLCIVTPVAYWRHPHKKRCTFLATPRRGHNKLYASKFVDASTLNRKNISRLVYKFGQPGTVNNLPDHRTHTALTLETLAMVSSSLSEARNKSLWRVAKEQNVSYGTAHCATCAPQLHPYCI